MNVSGLSPRAKLILWLVIAPLALVLLYAALIGVLCLTGLAQGLSYLEVVPARGEGARMRGTVWEYVGYNTAPLSWRQVMLHGNGWAEQVFQPGLDLLTRWSRRAAHDDDRLVVALGQALALRPEARAYDALHLEESFEPGSFELEVHHGFEETELYLFTPPGRLAPFER